MLKVGLLKTWESLNISSAFKKEEEGYRTSCRGIRSHVDVSPASRYRAGRVFSVLHATIKATIVSRKQGNGREGIFFPYGRGGTSQPLQEGRALGKRGVPYSLASDAAMRGGSGAHRDPMSRSANKSGFC